MDLSDRMSVKEACAYLHVSSKTIYRWVEAKRLPAIKVGLQLFIERDAVEAFSVGHGVYVDNLVQRIDTLEAQVNELRAEVNALKQSIASPAQPQPPVEQVQEQPHAQAVSPVQAALLSLKNTTPKGKKGTGS